MDVQPVAPVLSYAPAPPRPGRAMSLHACGAMLCGASIALAYVLPFLARKHFQAATWQVWVLTVSVPLAQSFSIFWNRLYSRLSPRAYLGLLAGLACGSLALMGLAGGIESILVLFAISALAGAGGGSALSPLNADLLRSLYAETARGRAFGLIAACQFVGTMAAGHLMGLWSDADPEAYRFFLPVTAAMMALGLACYDRIASGGAFRARTLPRTSGPWWAPLRDMGGILRADRRFATYEAAFMSYGVGWMICTALLPFIGQDRLRLDYSMYTLATVVSYQATNILLLWPMGHAADRMGPIRMSALSFGLLALYPLGLALAPSGVALALVTIFYAACMVGVHLAWTLGPVSFAPDASLAPQYLAVHTTLVGVRGLLFQGLGVGLYALTGSFGPALVAASAGFLWAAVTMRRLGAKSKIENPKSKTSTER